MRQNFSEKTTGCVKTQIKFNVCNKLKKLIFPPWISQFCKISKGEKYQSSIKES